ncbi:MAG: FimB/Mfa2 family fimbrial subunit [Tannerellaceae bacterium]|nr:FimB/Mfa2 family fimbrial subunit [Tannerellaceae bacterium]
MKKIEYILLLFAWIISFSGCVKENLDDCPPIAEPGMEEKDERYLYFRLRNSASTFEREVENLTLFAYDGNNQYVKDTILSRSELQASNYRFNMTD